MPQLVFKATFPRDWTTGVLTEEDLINCQMPPSVKSSGEAISRVGIIKKTTAAVMIRLTLSSFVK